MFDEPIHCAACGAYLGNTPEDASDGCQQCEEEERELEEAIERASWYAYDNFGWDQHDWPDVDQGVG